MPTAPARREFAKAAIDSAIHKALGSCERKPRQAVCELLWKVRHRSELLRPGRYVGRTEAGCVGRIVGGLLALVGHRKDWRRPVEEWGPVGSTAITMFSSLAHHLLAEYPVPPVLLSAWFLQGDDWEARRRQGWFRHAGMGRSLRTAGFPIRLTKRMAHEFAHAPARFPIDFALRWAQVRGLGGPDELARAVASTRLGHDFDGDEFWTSVIYLFLNTPKLDLGLVGPIVDYLHDQKFELQRVIIGEDTEITLGPPEPDLSVKGRTVSSLAKRAEEWRAERRRKEARRLFQWDRSGIGEYRRQGVDGRSWTIRELLDSDGLAAEGKAMHHCVADYTDRCARRLSAIWSLGLEGQGGRERLVTIEVDPETREVVQAQARCNEEPDETTRAILLEWAGQEGLKLGV